MHRLGADICSTLPRIRKTHGSPTGRQPDDIGEPRFGGSGTEPWVDLKAVGNQRGDSPAGAERDAQLALGHAARTPVAELAIAEAHEVQVAVRTENGVHGGDVPCAVAVVENVEQPAVDNRVKGIAERLQS